MYIGTCRGKSFGCVGVGGGGSCDGGGGGGGGGSFRLCLCGSDAR